MNKVLFFVAMVVIAVDGYPQDALNVTIAEAFEHYSVGGFAEAAPFFEEAYSILREIQPDDHIGSYKLALYTGLSYKYANSYTNAIKWFKESISIGETARKKPTELAMVYAYLADTERLQGKYINAIENYETAIKYRKISDENLAVMYYGLADSYRAIGDKDKAFQMCEMISSSGKLSTFDKVDLSCDLVQADSLLFDKNYSEALKLYKSVEDIAIARGYKDLEITASIGIGETSEILNLYDAALYSFERALFNSLDYEYYININKVARHMLPLLSRSKAKSINLAATIEKHGDSLTLAEGDISMVLWSLSSAMYQSHRQFNKMLSVSEKMYEYSLAENSEIYQVIGLYRIASSKYYLGNHEQAENYIAKAIPIAEAINYVKVLPLFYALQAENFIKMQDYERAAETMQRAIEHTKDNYYKLQYRDRLSSINNEIIGVANIHISKTDNVIFHNFFF